ncbi:hypothetical protein SH661x_004586 [Planctomicrobium sp. SH661]|uniref:hypothetical protein n=1 Tax=Planctomicrobium sp. SH661 TaxID=3448124 RepID=UPI003F5BDFA6
MSIMIFPLMFLAVLLFMGLVAVVFLVSLIKFGWMAITSLGLGGVLLLAVVVVGAMEFSRHQHHFAGPHKMKPPRYHLPAPALRIPDPPPAPQPPVMLPSAVPSPPEIAATTPPVVPTPVLSSDATGQPLNASDPISIVEVIHDATGREISRNELTVVPDWVNAPDAVTPSGFEEVLHSQRFATPEEARQQLWPVLQTRILDELAHSHADVRRWMPNHHDIEHAGVIVKECIVAFPLTVGDFQESVSQVHWLVRLDQQTTRDLLARWKPSLVNRRLFQVASLFGAAMLVMGAGAILLRR